MGREAGAEGVAVFEKILNDSTGDAPFARRVSVVDDIHAAGRLVPQFPGVLVLDSPEAAGLRGGEQVAEEAFRPAGCLCRDWAKREQDAEVRAEKEQSEEVGGVVRDHAAKFGQVRDGVL